MRLNNYLIEEEKLYSYLDIQKDCKPYLSELKSGKNILMRFSLNYKFDTIVKYALKKDREPVDTPKVLHDIMNDTLKEKFGWSPRSNGLFTWLLTKAKIKNLPMSYNKKPVLVFPIGNYKTVYNPTIEDIYMSWDEYISNKKEEEYSKKREGSISAKIPEEEIFIDWFEKFALPDYTSKNALNAHLYEYRIECMINAKNFYFIPQNLWVSAVEALEIKI
jgi:hypothetical protein